MEGNGLGSWKTAGDNGNFVMHGYTEPGQSNSQASPRTRWGGSQYVPVTGGTGLTVEGLDGPGLASSAGFYSRQITGNGGFTRSLFGPPHVGGSYTNYMQFNMSDVSGTFALVGHNSTRDFTWIFNGYYTALVTSETTDLNFGRPAPVPSAWNFALPFFGYGNEARGMTFTSGPPTTGAHAKGEVRWNNGTNPAHDAVDYWRCTAAGTPGTWVAKA